MRGSKETSRVVAVDSGVEWFLRRHPTRVSCVFIRGVGSSWNENGAPGGVRRELVFPAHFSRERPPENRLSPRGPTTVSRTILHGCYFGKSPVSIKPRREKFAVDDRRSPGCDNESGIATVNGTLRLFSKKEDANGKATRKNLRSYICHACECSLLGARKSLKISVLAPSEIAIRDKWKRGSFRYLIVCKVLNCCKKCFLCQPCVRYISIIFSVLIIYRRKYCEVNIAANIISSLVDIAP